MHGAPRPERGVSTKFHHRPVSRAGRAHRHLDILVRAVGLEPTKPLWATGLRPVSFATHSRARKRKFSKNLAESRGLEPDVPKRRNLSRILGYQLPMLSAKLRSLD